MATTQSNPLLTSSERRILLFALLTATLIKRALAFQGRKRTNQWRDALSGELINTETQNPVIANRFDLTNDTQLLPTHDSGQSLRNLPGPRSFG
jgi:hypothetical protein